MSIKKIPLAKLFASEPNPRYFGNSPNPEDWKSAGWTNANWLKSLFHFEFAEYRNRHASDFGVLRVVNDDLVQPARGFGEHPHSNMEIVTYIVSGELTHKDSMGSAETLGPGSVQFMTAGEGVTHSEYNASPTEPVRFIQSWIKPCSRGLPPKYGSYKAPETRSDGWIHIASEVGSLVETPIKLNQDIDMYALKQSTPNTEVVNIGTNRQGYLVCVGGSIDLNGTKLENHDAAEIQGPIDLTIKSDAPSELLLFTMKGGSTGRTDVQ
eukprot:TRINITY_DN46528_c0_g1_i1.p1 TRINITY_DN46528_c0_g1~~TRINITY_DN46528_c0_g1_i1.p1  ORF type:complete len:284 (+),score=60.11 TRINITY_DN46528_c0_g1_i1:54-854(+)